MTAADWHTHTSWSDGADSPEQMVRAALEMGMERIGISDHSYFAPDEEYCLPFGKTEAYAADIRALAQRYAGEIQVKCGIEQDLFSPLPAVRFDYIIGSVHWIAANGMCFAVDETPEAFERGVRDCFDGDYLRACEFYFANVELLPERTGADIVGHFDLISKYNGKKGYFDENDPRYERAWRKAADALLASGVSIEVNTGGMYRGWRDVPYPAPPIRRYLQAHGARFVWSSDAHCADAVGFAFPERTAS